jgi:hypothetical protein
MDTTPKTSPEGQTCLKLADLIRLAGRESVLQDFKIHCAQRSKKIHPIDLFREGKFDEWQKRQNKKNFGREHVLSLIDLRRNRWLFAGVFKVDGPPTPTDEGEWEYSLSKVSGLDHLIGRAIVKFKKAFKCVYLNGQKYIDKMEISEIGPDEVFPGH